MRRRAGSRPAHPLGSRPDPMDALFVALALLPLSLGCAAVRDAGEPVAAGTDRAFSHTVRVGAPPEAVWALWTDVAGWPRWDTELDSASLDGPFAAGARGRLVPKRGPSARFTVTELDPGRSYTFETALPMARLRVRRFWTEAAGGPEITHAVSFHGPLGGVFARRLGPAFRRALPPVMEHVRARVQADGASPGGAP